MTVKPTTIWFGKPTRKPSGKYPDFVSSISDPTTGKRHQCGLWLGPDQVGLKIGSDVAFLDRAGDGMTPFAAGSIRRGGKGRAVWEADLDAIRIGDTVCFRLKFWP